MGGNRQIGSAARDRSMGDLAKMVAEVREWRRPTKAEQEAAKKKEELEEKHRVEEEQRRAKEDQIIAQIEKDFWENSKKIADGSAAPVKCERRPGPGIPVAAPSLETLISDDDLDRLLTFLEEGNEVNLEPRSEQPTADEAMMEKAQHLVEVLTASLNDGDKDLAKKAISEALEKQNMTDRRRQVQEEQAAVARGEECELERMFKEMHPEAREQATEAADDSEQRARAKVKEAADAARQEAAEESARRLAAQASVVEETVAAVDEALAPADEVTSPDYAVEVVEEEGVAVRVVVRIQLPLVKSAGDIDAGVVDAQVLELEVPGVYSLRTKLPVPIDEDKMACRFDKKKKCLTVKLPALDAD